MVVNRRRHGYQKSTGKPRQANTISEIGLRYSCVCDIASWNDIKRANEMKCPTCNANVPDAAAFCPQCGARMKGGVPAQAAAARPADPAAHSPQSLRSPVNPAGDRGQRDVPEEQLWQGGYSPKAMYGAWIGAAVATIAGLVAVLLLPNNNGIGWMIFGAAAVVIWLFLLGTLAYRRLSDRYRLTNQRFFHEHGILRRVTDRVEVIDIDDVIFEQGIIERMLGVGTLRISSSDKTTPELSLPGIDNIKVVADTVDQARRAERHRRSLYIESV
jgi:membrane protein YdbS with pleckstrin-like domain